MLGLLYAAVRAAGRAVRLARRLAGRRGLLLLLYIVPVLLVIRWLDAYEREPRSMMFGAFLWGFARRPPLRRLRQRPVGHRHRASSAARSSRPSWSAALTAPLNEEIYKYLGLVVLFLIARTEFDDLLDGFVYGALIGLGFAVAEDLMYFIFNFGGSVADVVAGLLSPRRAVRPVRPRDVHGHRRHRLRLLRDQAVDNRSSGDWRSPRAAAAGDGRALCLELTTPLRPADPALGT